jgi:diguanylate cyclase (GGDEF)-like protein
MSKRTVELEDALNELSQVNETLREINTMDSVTGIKNRHFFDSTFKNEWRRASREQYPISILLMDIDHFKKVNDNHGHVAGDECLRAVANTISTTIKRPADILARYGGEEFVAELPYIENENAMYFANQIRERIAASTYIADKQEINVTMSIGVCTVTPKETDELKDVISAADIALYEAKNTGRNRVRNAGQLTVHTGNVVS